MSITLSPRMEEVQESIDFLREQGEQVGLLSDGFHTYNELYAHRIELSITLAKQMAAKFGRSVWISKVQSDGKPVEEGWMLLGINKRKGDQITYHIPIACWDRCAKFAENLKRAPEYDGHTAADVLERLAKL